MTSMPPPDGQFPQSGPQSGEPQQPGVPPSQSGQPQQPGVPPQQPGVPPQQSGQPQQPDPPAPSGGGKPLLFGGIGVIVGLLIGVLAGSTLLGGGGGGGAGSGPDADAQAACAYVEASVDQVNEESMSLDQPLIWQLQGAGALAQAAATGDESYAEFGGQGRDLFQASATLDLELAQTTLEDMEQSCADF